MMNRFLALFVAFGVIFGAAPALAQVSQEDAAAILEESYDVRVLKTEAGEVDGQPVWMVTLMNEGGDFNDAFAVFTVAVDRQSGKLVPAYQTGVHGSGGGQILGGGDKEGINPRRAREGVWR